MKVRPVLIRWHDAHDAFKSWSPPDWDGVSNSTAPVESVGWLVRPGPKDDAGFVTLACSWDQASGEEPPGHFAGGIHIPLVNIISCHRLDTGAKVRLKPPA